MEYVSIPWRNADVWDKRIERTEVQQPQPEIVAISTPTPIKLPFLEDETQQSNKLLVRLRPARKNPTESKLKFNLFGV